GSLGAAASQSHLIGTQFSWGIAIGAMAGGVIGSYLGGRYLLCYTETPAERAAVHRFVHYSTFTAMLVCLTVLALTTLQAPIYGSLTVMVLGTALVNYQCLVPLQRIMAPMIARDAARKGRTGPSWVYQSMYGRPALVVTNLVIVGIVLAMARERGLI
ncbi:MAG: RNA polymerase subunit sigma-70, partial [Stenotrophomonas sp.]